MKKQPTNHSILFASKFRQLGPLGEGDRCSEFWGCTGPEHERWHSEQARRPFYNTAETAMLHF